ncbi:PREDICTED: beta-D-glucosyl crocetin beta-1,6-glucosyltransferase-like [Nicotiana attenuata]|uniref:Glycosyltransferase n=1 Tax=Nicotiana attenuata TaxID=49451 RepID=A0A1J6IXZ4_NICAT|nr:PREDICTED: beta-D-glucosyl crocetin beta-1,6-glucosyltransferase-like [Nicotiana attenuata]AQQ16683.1 UDP-glycosyltransferase g25918 [Nicotiana attenuata]OIS99984.1 flavanone 7-o-glucoside 2''-o-beta-l-rhamnosyltransferase [Nicotiana attenuata]
MDLQGITSLRVLMFPWLAYGHISPYLNIAKKLIDKDFYIYLCSTPINLNLIKQKIPQNYSLSIDLVELHLPKLPELPPIYHTTNGLPPHLISALRIAFNMSKPEFSKILQKIKPDLLIYDMLPPWAEEVATLSHNVPAVMLLTSGAAAFSHVLHSHKNSSIEFPFPALYLSKIEQQQFQVIMEQATKEKDHEDKLLHPLLAEIGNSKRIILMSTSKAIEAKYIDYITELSHWKVVPTGYPIQDHDPMNIQDDDDDLIDWLGTKNERSTVFVSFGSEYLLSKEDFEEIAFGLELSQVNFIWVVRFHKEEEAILERVLPKDFLEKIGDRGKVVDGWVPQQRILNHSSIGGFVSHCGWNSVMESIEFSVPIIAMPMHIDQPINARLMVELGAAVEIVKDEEGKIGRQEVAQVIRGVICEKNGESLRKKVRHISENFKSVRGEEMDAAVEVIIKICKNSQSVKNVT